MTQKEQLEAILTKLDSLEKRIDTLESKQKRRERAGAARFYPNPVADEEPQADSHIVNPGHSDDGTS